MFVKADSNGNCSTAFLKIRRPTFRDMRVDRGQARPTHVSEAKIARPPQGQERQCAHRASTQHNNGAEMLAGGGVGSRVPACLQWPERR